MAQEPHVPHFWSKPMEQNIGLIVSILCAPPLPPQRVSADCFLAHF